MQRVLHIFGKMDRAGAETRTMEVMRNIDHNQYIFDYLACSGQCGEYDSEIKALGGEVYKKNIYSLKFFPYLFRLIKKNKYEIIHSHIHYVSGLIMLVAWLAGSKKRISHFRTAESESRNKTFKNRILKILVALLSTDILAVNHYTMEHVWGVKWENNKKCSILVNGIESKYIPNFNSDDLKREFGLGESQLILHVGRIEKQKNHSFLVRVFYSYINEHPDTILILVGRNDTQEAKILIEKIKNLGIQDKILMTGVRSDVSAFLNMADVMVFPSLWEGLPGAVLEALSAGLPVVASNIGCHQEIKQKIDNLHIIDLDDDILKWSSAIEHAVKDENREEIRERFIQSPYYIDRYVEDFKQLYSR